MSCVQGAGVLSGAQGSACGSGEHVLERMGEENATIVLRGF